MDTFLDWQQAYQAGPALCGGKGYNLARLARYGFRVPRGGVLAAGAPFSAIREGLERLRLMDARLAVRSSATAEDSARASFAGIHASFLNVSGLPAIEQAAQNTINSLQTPQAIAYRRRMGFRDEEVQCAVVFCEMVEARSAGVAFSCDPVTGRRDLILIDAAEGLGEAVVGGRVNPQRIVWRNQHRLAREPGAGPWPWLPASVEEELAHQVWRVQWALGEGQDPQDVEWAYDGERLWLLQARPVTRVPRAGWPETAAMPRYWSTANIKDGQPGVSSEFSWSLLTEIVGDAAYAAQIAAGYRRPPGMEIVRRFHGRGYFDLTLMQWVFYDAFGLTPHDVIKEIGGQQPEISVPGDTWKGSKGNRRRVARIRLLRRLWNHPRRALAAIGPHIERILSLAALDRTGDSLAELDRAMRQIADLQDAFIPVFGLANASAGPWQMGLETLVKDKALIGRLQAGTGAVTSAEHGYRLYEIASGKATVEEFLRDFGHRGVYETDVMNPRWIEDSSWVQEQVDAIRRNPPPPDPREAAAEIRREAERELRRRLGWLAPLPLWLVRKLRESSAAREGTKSAMVSAILPMRKIVLEIGRRLVAASQLDAPEGAFEMAHVDLICLLRGYWDGQGARELTGDRELRRAAWLAETAPDLIMEEPDGRMAAPTPIAFSSESGVWSGYAVSPGTARGRARLVRDPKAGDHLQQGDILIAPSTDPGWSPLFPARCGGGDGERQRYLSHGAIVAREYGIPAVANVPGIMEALSDGEDVMVDGSAGRVAREIHSPISRLTSS